MKPILLFFCLLFLYSCKIDRKKIIDRDKFTFKMNDDNELFFKNVRQIYYDFTDLPQAKWHAFRFSDRYQGEDRPMLHPVIVMDWMHDEAYLLIEFNEVLADETQLEIREQSAATGKRYAYLLRERGRENMLEFATKIYEAVMAGNTLSIKVQGKYEPLLEADPDREAFRTVMADYYRLTNIF